jgi:hypothetical protein
MAHKFKKLLLPTSMKTFRSICVRFAMGGRARARGVRVCANRVLTSPGSRFRCDPFERFRVSEWVR